MAFLGLWEPQAILLPPRELSFVSIAKVRQINNTLSMMGAKKIQSKISTLCMGRATSKKLNQSMGRNSTRPLSNDDSHLSRRRKLSHPVIAITPKTRTRTLSLLRRRGRSTSHRPEPSEPLGDARQRCLWLRSHYILHERNYAPGNPCRSRGRTRSSWLSGNGH